MSYPRKYAVATAAGDHLKDLDWDAMVDAANGMTTSGATIQYPYSYLIRKSGGFYESVDDHGIITYGGSSDAGGADGTDPSAVIQESWDDLAGVGGKGGRIFIKSIGAGLGDYVLPSSLNLTIPGGGFYTEIVGENKYGVTLDGSALATYAANIYGAVGAIGIRNIRIHGGVNLTAPVGNITLENIKFGDSGAGKWNIKMDGSSDIKILKCDILNGVLGGILMEANATYDVDDVQICNCVFNENTDYTIKAVGFSGPNLMARNILIANNWIECSNTAPCNAIDIYRGKGVRISNNTIAGRSDATHDFIHLDSDSELTVDTIINGNSIYPTSPIPLTEGRYGIYVGANTSNTVISSNTIYGYTYGLVTVAGARKITVVNNPNINSWLQNSDDRNNFFEGNNVTTAVGNIVRQLPSDGIVFYMPLDEGTGTALADWSGYGNNGVSSGGETWVTGKFKGAMHFDGVDGKVAVAHDPALDVTGSFAITLWVKVDVYINDAGIISKAGAGAPFWTLNTKTTGFDFRLNDGDEDVEVIIASASTNWLFLVAQINGQKTDGGFISINAGVPVTADTSTLGSMVFTNNNLALGVALNSTTYSHCSVDDVRIYNHALSDDDIRRIYLLGPLPHTA
jgi:hypothetical protein